MSPQEWDRCKDIFFKALDLAAADRAAFVDGECGLNEPFRQRLLSMLAAGDGFSPLDVPAAQEMVGNIRLAEPLIPGDIISRYRILRIIGQGGTSLVYLAEHTDFRSPRRFAIKVIASASFAYRRERFERECEILAAFEHPNIARIIDIGMTASGWPYLVMDYVDGLPFHKYTAQNGLAAPEIVRLVLDCCKAVEYMHGKLIIHCDLKPSNILVDTTGSPLILDFGIARIIEPSGVTRGGQTTRGIQPFTPDYASPEQLKGAILTTATDIYSLAVVLFEALAGALPFDRSSSSWHQSGSKIMEHDPLPPSKARLAQGGAGKDTDLAQQIRGDLDSIVLKALALEPAKRYASAGDFRADLQRYLDGQAVTARSATFKVLASKLGTWRKRNLVQILTLFFCVAITVGFSWLYFERQRDMREAQYLGELRGIVTPLSRALKDDRPNSVAARQDLAERGTAVIESLYPVISLHSKLAPEMAEVLIGIADLFGNPYVASLDRVTEARKYYQHAYDLVAGTDRRFADLRARACVGLGDTFIHRTLSRDPSQAAEWYQRAIRELSTTSAEYRNISSVAYARMGNIYELLASTDEAVDQYRKSLALFMAIKESDRSPDSGQFLLRRASMEPPMVREDSYEKALRLLDRRSGGQLSSETVREAIEAHLSLGLARLETRQLARAEAEFARAADLEKRVLTEDPNDMQARKELAVALRRRALVAAMEGRIDDSNTLRAQATETLRTTLTLPATPEWSTGIDAACPTTLGRIGSGRTAGRFERGDLLIGNRRTPATAGNVILFSPAVREMSIIAESGYISDLRDVTSASGKELYVLVGSLEGAGGVVRLSNNQEGWFQTPVTCGGLLRQPTALAYYDERLIVVLDVDKYKVRLIGIDPESGHQTLLGQTRSFTKAGKILRLPGGDLAISLFWPGEGGPAEILRFNVATRKFQDISRYGLLDSPVTFAVTSQRDLIAGNREWVGNGGFGSILRIGSDGVQRTVCRRPELARVTAVAVTSTHEAWFSTASVPYSTSRSSYPKLFKLDLTSGSSLEVTINDEVLAAPVALVGMLDFNPPSATRPAPQKH